MEAAMKRLFTRFGSLDDHLKELLRGAMTAASLKIVAALATFGLHLMLGRMLGPEGSGIYFLAFTIVTIAATLARFGLDNTLVRFIAAGEAANQPERVRGVYRFSVWITAIISCVLGGLLCAMASWLAISIFKDDALTTPLQIMALAVPPFALSVIHAQALQGLKRIRDAMATLSVIAPVTSTVLIYPFILQFGISGAVTAYVIAVSFSLLFGVWRWKKAIVHYRSIAPTFTIKELMGSSVSLFWVALINMLISWLSTLMLGMFESSYEVGLFSAANRTAMLVSFVLVAVNSIAAPKFAVLYAQGDIKTLRKVANASNRMMTMFALPVLAVFTIFPEYVLKLFGSQFSEASIALSVLAFGQFINVATGSVGYLLMMTGQERVLRNNLFVTAVVCIALNAFLIPLFGTVGAAGATSSTIIFQNLLSYISVRRKVFVEQSISVQ